VVILSKRICCPHSTGLRSQDEVVDAFLFTAAKVNFLLTSHNAIRAVRAGLLTDLSALCFVRTAGMSRSVTHVLGYLMRAQGMSLLNALQFVQEKRALSSPNSGFMSALAEVELELFNTSSIDLETYRNDRFCSTDELRRSTATPAAAVSLRCSTSRHRTAPRQRGFFEEEESSGDSSQTWSEDSSEGS
jgi:Dual specificity phosphatase, catalytic domain